jgi:hypothetical protein
MVRHIEVAVEESCVYHSFYYDCCLKNKKNVNLNGFIIRRCYIQIQYNKAYKEKIQHCYPNILSSSVALYWSGISIKAESANSASFLDRSMFFDIISVKFTNYRRHSKTEKKNQV